MMTIKELLCYAIAQLNAPEGLNDKSTCTQDARILLLSACSTLTLEALFTDPDRKIDCVSKKKFLGFIKRRKEGYSVSAITGTKFFYDSEFCTDEKVLIPRPETEELVEMAVNYANDTDKTLSILDMCTGTGCIGLSIAKSCANIKEVLLSDISPFALNIAKKNASHLGVNVAIIESDLFRNIPKKRFDIITANPPYVSADEYKNLSTEVKKEPRIALLSDDNGLEHIKKIIKGSVDYIKKDGLILIEIGESQGIAVLEFAKAYYPNSQCFIKKDLSGKDRMLSIINTL